MEHEVVNFLVSVDHHMHLVLLASSYIYSPLIPTRDNPPPPTLTLQ